MLTSTVFIQILAKSAVSSFLQKNIKDLWYVHFLLINHFIKWLEKVKVASFDKLNPQILTLQVNDMEFVGRGRGNYEKQQRTHVDGYRCRPKNTQNIAKLRCLPQNQSGTDDDIYLEILEILLVYFLPLGREIWFAMKRSVNRPVNMEAQNYLAISAVKGSC